MRQFIERTLFMIKPDGVKRNLIGESIKRVEDSGLKVVAMKMVQATKDQANRHYPSEKEDKSWFLGVAEKAKKGYEEKGMKWKYKDDMEYGRMIKSFLVDFITSGPVVAMVVEGPNAISMVRKLSGATEPRSAQPGTIRGDYGIDSYDMANTLNRAVKNVIHASSSREDAEKEIKVWFKKDEIVKYKRCDEEEMFAGFKK